VIKEMNELKLKNS